MPSSTILNNHAHDDAGHWQLPRTAEKMGGWFILTKGLKYYFLKGQAMKNILRIQRMCGTFAAAKMLKNQGISLETAVIILANKPIKNNELANTRVSRRPK